VLHCAGDVLLCYASMNIENEVYTSNVLKILSTVAYAVSFQHRCAAQALHVACARVLLWSADTLVATKRRERGGVFDFDAGTAAATAATAARVASGTTATAAGVASGTTATAATATAATAATAVSATVVTIVAFGGLRRSDSEANVKLLLFNVLAAFTLTLDADATEVQGVIGVRVGDERQASKCGAIKNLRFGLLPLCGESRTLLSLKSFSLSEGELVGFLFGLNGFGLRFLNSSTFELSELFARLAPVALAGAIAVAVVAAARSIPAVEVTTRASAAFAAFASTTSASRAGVTFMITSPSLGVEVLHAFGTDDFALEFSNSLRGLRLVGLSRGGTCKAMKQIDRVSLSFHSVP